MTAIYYLLKHDTGFVLSHMEMSKLIYIHFNVGMLYS